MLRTDLPALRPARRWVVVACCLLAMAGMAGCQGRLDVDVQLSGDGSGLVRVGVGVDADALARYPQLAGQVRTDDVRAAGWAVTGPSPEGDGFSWWRLSKPYANPQEAASVLAEVGGQDGPLAKLRLAVQRSFGQTTYRVAGDVDFSGGLERFTDSGLSSSLDGKPLGVSQSELENQLGAPVAQLVSVKVTVQLPGRPPMTVTPSLAGPAVPLDATVTLRRTPTMVAAGVALVAVLLALVWIVGHVVRRRWRATRRAVA